MTACASIPEASYIEYARLLAMHPLASYHMVAASQWLMNECCRLEIYRLKKPKGR
jgi:hypothetical protein